MSKYHTAESWSTNGGGAYNLGDVNSIEELPEFARDIVRNDSNSDHWRVEIPDTDGELTLVISLVE